MKKADAFTLVRIVFAPIFFFLYFIPLWTGLFVRVSAYVLLPLLMCAEFTDFLDGFYARKENAVSDFGKLFDPFADVFLHITAFLCYAFSGYMPLWTLVLIMHRELGMLFLRLIAVKRGVTIGAKTGGKIKTVLYIASGMFSLALESAVRCGLAESFPLQTLKYAGFALYILCVVFSYASFIDYVVSFKRSFSAKKG